MTRLARWSLVLALLPLAACSHRETMENTAAQMTAQPAAPAAPAPLSETDTTFVTQAAQSGMAEVQAGQMAAQKATRPAVRQFAQQMVDQHTQLNQQLMQLAQAHGITPPAEVGQPYTRQMSQLDHASRGAFDRDYIRSQIANHRATIALFQREAQEGQDPALKSFAAQALPTLQQHLQEAQGLAGGRGAMARHRPQR